MQWNINLPNFDNIENEIIKPSILVEGGDYFSELCLWLHQFKEDKSIRIVIRYNHQSTPIDIIKIK